MVNSIRADEYMMLKDLVLRNRSCRRFVEAERVPLSVLLELVELARLSASGGNAQPLKYLLCANTAKNALIFPCLSWAAHLKDWGGPKEGERPSAYIVIVLDTDINKTPGCDHGIAAQSILLGAAERGLSGCMIGSFSKEGLPKALGLDSGHAPVLVIALGKAAERIVIDEAKDGNVKYWRDASGVHHVPKRPLKELVLASYD